MNRSLSASCLESRVGNICLNYETSVKTCHVFLCFPKKANTMSFVHSHSFYTTIDLLCRNMSLALSICQQGTNPNSNALAAQNVSKEFASLIGQVSNAYAQVAPPFLVPVNDGEVPDTTDQVEEAIKNAMSIKPTHDEEPSGGVAFNHANVVNLDVDLDSSNEDTDDDSSSQSSDSSIDVESMLPGQRENYFKTKRLADGLRRAKMADQQFLTELNNM